MKAQASMVFVYITAIIIFAVVLLFGYKAISGFIEKGEQAAFITFKLQLEKAVKDISIDTRSVRVYNKKNPLSIPGKYNSICFIDMDASPPETKPAELNIIAWDSWVVNSADPNNPWDGWENSESNVFFDPPEETSVKVPKIRVEGSYKCLDPVNYELRLEGRGDHTYIR